MGLKRYYLYEAETFIAPIPVSIVIIAYPRILCVTKIITLYEFFMKHTSADDEPENGALAQLAAHAVAVAVEL